MITQTIDRVIPKPLSQAQRLLALLSDYQWHSTPEVLDVVYGNDHLGLARVGARIYDLKKQGHEIVGKDDETRSTIYWYRLVPSEPHQEAIFA